MAGRPPTKTEAAMQETFLRYQVAASIVEWVGKVAAILSFGLPLWLVGKIADSIAGKTTVVDVRLVFEWAIGGAFVVWLFVLRTKCSKQKKDLERLRKRCGEIEQIKNREEASASSGGNQPG